MENKNLTGKKLLILGAYKSEIEIVQAARSMGVYTITTDNHINWNEAPAKKVSDEAWDISWSDVETMAALCEDNLIDGIMAGFSEKRVEYALKLSHAIKKPFYTDGADIEKIFDKVKFKTACTKVGISIPKKFDISTNVDFPVIVKPADNGGSRGISICYNKNELEIAYDKALSFSDAHDVIIEEYLTCNEIMVYFTVHNGQATLSAMCDRYMHRFDKNITQLPVAYYYPSKYLALFIKYNLRKYQNLIKELKIRDGLIAFQAFIKGNEVIPFDPTYRLDGTMAYHMIKQRNGINVLEMLINKSLTGSMGNDEEITSKENPYFSSPCFELPILLGKGIIKQIEGLDKIDAMQDVLFVYVNHNVGDVMNNIADFSQILCRIHICASNNTQIEKDVQEIYSYLKVFDENGNDMIIGRNTFTVGY